MNAIEVITFIFFKNESPNHEDVDFISEGSYFIPNKNVTFDLTLKFWSYTSSFIPESACKQLDATCIYRILLEELILFLVLLK